MNPKTLALLRKTGLTVLTCISCVLLLEAGLRISARAAQKKQEQRLTRPIQDQTIRILCIGESTTAWGGDDAYPAQLERLLNKASGPYHYQIFNHGRTGVRTPQIIQALPEAIAQTKPHIIIAMMGINDDADWLYNSSSKSSGHWYESWQIFKFAAAQRAYAGHATNKAPALRLETCVKSFKAGRTPDAHSREGRLWKLINDRKLKAAENLIIRMLQINPHNEYAMNGSARIRVLQQKEEESLFILNSAITLFPYSDWAHTELGEIYINRALVTDNMHDYEAAAGAYRDALQLNPDNLWALADLAYIYLHQQRAEDAQLLLEHAIGLEPHHPILHLRMAQCMRSSGNLKKAEQSLLRAREAQAAWVNPVTASSYRKLEALANTSAASLVIMQYPTREPDILKSLLDHPLNTTFVSNETNFRNALETHGSSALFTDMFAGDFGHCTPFGNSLIASNLVPVVHAQLQRLQPVDPQ